MARMLEVADHEFKTTMINMLRTIIKKIDNMQNRKMEILRINKNTSDQKHCNKRRTSSLGLLDWTHCRKTLWATEYLNGNLQN